MWNSRIFIYAFTWFLESLIIDADYIPEHIIFITSPRQFRESNNVNRVKSQIYDLMEKPIGLTTEFYDYVNKILKRILKGLNGTISNLPEKILADQANLQKKHALKIQSLDSEAVSEFIKKKDKKIILIGNTLLMIGNLEIMKLK